INSGTGGERNKARGEAASVFARISSFTGYCAGGSSATNRPIGPRRFQTETRSGTSSGKNRSISKSIESPSACGRRTGEIDSKLRRSKTALQRAGREKIKFENGGYCRLERQQ